MPLVSATEDPHFHALQCSPSRQIRCGGTATILPCHRQSKILLRRTDKLWERIWETFGKVRPSFGSDMILANARTGMC